MSKDKPEIKMCPSILIDGILILICLFATGVKADTYLTTTIASYHADREEEYNEFNPGLGIRHNNWIAGAYVNSHENPAWYAGREFRKPMDGYQLALQLGALHGYKDSQLEAPSHNGIYLYALPSVVIGGDVQHKLGIVPVDNWTLTYQIDWRF